MIPKLTLHGGIFRESTLLPAVKTLKGWEAEGKVEVFETDRAKEVPATNGWPGATKPVVRPTSKYKTLKKPDSKSGVSFHRIASVLFPTRDPQRLNMTEINDVAHMLRHHSLGHTIFVTTNTKDFISGGKREQLQSAFKIVVLTPEETVAALLESDSWAEKSAGEVATAAAE